MRYWLMKSEPDETSIDDALAAKDQTVAWTGVRNYQARNFMRDQMQVGDGVLFYHSGCAEPGIAGIAEVASTCYPDPTQFDRKSPYHDPKSSPDKPRWLLVDVRVLKKIRLKSQRKALSLIMQIPKKKKIKIAKNFLMVIQKKQ